MRGLAGERRGYKSYLLRLWESDDQGKPIWRASLESPGTGELQGFATLQALIAFLEEQTAGRGEQSERNK